MYIRNIFKFDPTDYHRSISFRNHHRGHQPQQVQQNDAILNQKWKKSLIVGSIPVETADSTGSVLGLSDLNDSNAAFLVTVSIISGFLLLVVFASIYYYRKRGTYYDFSGAQPTSAANNKVLLLNKDIPLEKSFVVKKTPAIRSPSSSQVNPFNKKSPSPTNPQQSNSGFASPNDETAKNKNTDYRPESSKAIGGSNSSSAHNSKQCSPIEEKIPRNYGHTSTTKTATTAITEDTAVKHQHHVGDQQPPHNGQTEQPVEALKASGNNQQQQQQQQQQKSLGKLHFRLKYSYEKRALCVVIIRCQDLVLKDQNGPLDPYVKMQLLPEKQHKAKTRVLRKSQNPVYNEEFTFYGITANMLENLTIHFVVLNFDRFSRDEILGEIVYRLNQFEFDSLDKQITLCKDLQPCGNKLKVQDLGELLVSLCYQPIANRLTVVVLKARNLPKMDLTGLCDPYVKIYVFYKNERISKKRTHTKKRTLSPVFNESFVFDIPPEEGLDNIRLQFMVYDHDRVTRNELIGKIEIGSKTGQQTTEKHWHEVIKSPRRQIAEWHKLRESTTNTNNN